jgi:hypothetical protein
MPKLLITRRTGWNIFIELDGAVGKRGPNYADDVLVVSLMLAKIQRAVRTFGSTPVLPTRVCDGKIQKAIEEFQQYIQKRYQPPRMVCDGVVDPVGNALDYTERTLGWLHNEVMDQSKGNNTFIKEWPGSLFDMSVAGGASKIFTKF